MKLLFRRAVRRGFQFTLMVVGESGLGKSTLVNIHEASVADDYNDDDNDDEHNHDDDDHDNTESVQVNSMFLTDIYSSKLGSLPKPEQTLEVCNIIIFIIIVIVIIVIIVIIIITSSSSQ